ncbi:glycosyltransferase family 2 protein [Candidatus Omnitrophota bacterium]
MEFSVIIPVFNEAGSVPGLQERLDKAMGRLSAQYEIIYVDDGSNDLSLSALKDIEKRYQRVKTVSLPEHKGQSAALYAGFKASQGKWIITLDADGQNPPEEIMRLLEVYPRFDFITGVRHSRQDSFFRKGSAQTARFFRRIVLGDTTRDTGCSLRLFRREVMDSFPFFKNFHRFFPFLAKTTGFSIKEIDVSHEQRRLGRSKYKTTNRLQEGILDLGRVFWLKKRLKESEKQRFK